MARGGVAMAGCALLLCAVGGGALWWRDGTLSSWLPTAEASTPLPPVGAPAPETGLAITALGRLEPRTACVASPDRPHGGGDRAAARREGRSGEARSGDRAARRPGAGRRTSRARAAPRQREARARAPRRAAPRRRDLRLAARRAAAPSRRRRAPSCSARRAELERDHVRSPDRRPGARRARARRRARRSAGDRRARRRPTTCSRSPRSTRRTSARVRVGQRATVASPALAARARAARSSASA